MDTMRSREVSDSRPSSMIALSERQSRTLLLGAFLVLSWTTLWAWSQTPSGQHFHHAGATFSMVYFASGWALMTVAMMLPTTFPLLSLFHGMLSDRRRRALLVGL